MSGLSQSEAVMTQHEVAEKLGWKLETVRYLERKAKEKIRKQHPSLVDWIKGDGDE